jgi:YD repeat-containing protein
VGSNIIAFSYNNSNQISAITDTVNRTFLLCYTNNLLTSILQISGGTCVNPQVVRRVAYGNNGQSLTNATDPAGRKTIFTYGSNSWLLTQITYPTLWYDRFVYTSAVTGVQSLSYRVANQFVNSTLGQPIRRFDYTYSQPVGDQITGATVRAYNGTQLASITDFAFSFASMIMNVSDANHTIVRGLNRVFGVGGEPIQETTIVSDGSGKVAGYTNYYGYDLWGNVIYSRKAINPSIRSYHESFNSYYNDGLPLGFNAFQDTFSQNQGTATDNQWQTQNGYWVVHNGFYNGTGAQTGQASMLAWSDVGAGNLTIQASINVTQPLAGDDSRVGIFVHYPGSGVNKWALVFHNRGGTMYFELLDDQVSWLGDTQPFGKTPCPLNYNSWYTLSMTIQYAISSGQPVYTALGSVSTPGQQPCNGVMGNFPVSSPAATATGFGLYSGGYSSLFDNVTVSTNVISPSLGMSSIVASGAPAPTIHGALAGTAQHQNGTGSAPVESSYSYYPWGGLNQTQSFYQSQSGNQWLTTSRKYDTYGNPVTITDPRGNSTTLAYSTLYQSAYLTSKSQALKPGRQPSLHYTATTSQPGRCFPVSTQTGTTRPIPTTSWDALRRSSIPKESTGTYRTLTMTL